MRRLFLVVLVFFLLFPLSWAATCGDGTCDPGENACNCSGDCGECTGEVVGKFCKEYGCLNDICRVITIPNCCPNSLCESGEDYGNCPGDCTPKEITGELLQPTAEDSYMRGDELPLKVSALADGRSIASADIKVSGFFESVTLLNDGRHNDDNISDNVYGNTIVIGPDAPAGQQPITVDMNFVGVKNTLEGTVNVDPYLDHPVELPDNYILGDIIEISGTVSRRGEPQKIPVDVNIIAEETTIFSTKTVANKDGEFTASYHTTMLDPVGDWTIIARGQDKYGNELDINQTTRVSLPRLIYPLIVEEAGIIEEKLERGKEMVFIVRVKDEQGGVVSNADAEVITPMGERITLKELQQGQYTASHTIAYRTPPGKQTYRIIATLEENDRVYRGSSKVSVDILETELSINVLEPTKRYFRIGETIAFEVEVVYPTGELVGAADVKGLIEGNELDFKTLASGVFKGTYTFTSGDEGKTKIFLRAEDTYGNVGLVDRRIEVAGQTLFYMIQENIGIILLGTVVVIGLLAFFGKKYYRKLRASRLRQRKTELIELEKETQKGYFEDGTLTKQEYTDRMAKYEAELKYIEQNIMDSEEKHSLAQT